MHLRSVSSIYVYFYRPYSRHLSIFKVLYNCTTDESMFFSAGELKNRSKYRTEETLGIRLYILLRTDEIIARLNEVIACDLIKVQGSPKP